MWGEFSGSPTSSKASRYYNRSKEVRDAKVFKQGIIHTAVSVTCPSVSSTFPPGNAVWPGCERKVLDRVVNNTRSCPAFSYSRAKTAANLELGRPDLC